MALLEAYRIYSGDKKERNADHAIRVCQAIIAKVFGYESRADWSDEVRTAWLIDDNYDTDKKEQYKKLTDMVNNIMGMIGEFE